MELASNEWGGYFKRAGIMSGTQFDLIFEMPFTYPKGELE